MKISCLPILHCSFRTVNRCIPLSIVITRGSHNQGRTFFSAYDSRGQFPKKSPRGSDWPDIRRGITQRHNAQRHLGQSKDGILCVSFATRTCNVWRNVICRICRSIGRHFKRSVDTFILALFVRSNKSQNISEWKANVFKNIHKHKSSCIQHGFILYACSYINT